MFSKLKRKTSEQKNRSNKNSNREFNRKASEDRTLFDDESSVTLSADVLEKGLKKSHLLEKVIPSFFVFLPGFT